MNDGAKLRIRIVYIFIFTIGVILLTRLFFVQAIKKDHYRELANSQYVARSSEYFDRGLIYFKRKDGQLISAASLKKGYLVAIKPDLVENAQEAYEKISKIIDLDKEQFFKSAEKKGDPYEEVAHKITKDKADIIADLGIDGVNIYSETWRFYPAGELASRVLGFVGYNGNVLEGRYGIEKYYEDVLTRRKEGVFKVNSFAEIILDIKNLISGGVEDGDAILSIEPEAQSFLEDILAGAQKKYEAEMAGGIVLEPSTGKILAMSALPNFNPNNYKEAGSWSLFLNPIVQNVFEMGSIMKPITMAAALDQGVITPRTKYEDKGYVVLNNKKIENYDGKARGEVDMQEVLNQSLNTGAVFAMQQLGKERFKQYMLDFGFGEKTGIDLPDEISGLVSNLESGREIEYATASYGQGIAVTPIEMASALASLANGGIIMRPYVVEEVKTIDLTGKKTEPQIRRRVLSRDASEEISRMLVKVVDTALLGGSYKIDNYSVAAKTGTAQLYNGETGEYYEDEHFHSFFGYAPAFDAKFLTLLFLVKPQGVRYASHSLTEPFMNITKFLLNYYEVAPDR